MYIEALIQMSVFTLKVIANCTVSDHYLGFKLPDNLQNIF